VSRICAGEILTTDSKGRVCDKITLKLEVVCTSYKWKKYGSALKAGHTV